MRESLSLHHSHVASRQSNICIGCTFKFTEIRMKGVCLVTKLGVIFFFFLLLLNKVPVVKNCKLLIAMHDQINTDGTQTTQA